MSSDAARNQADEFKTEGNSAFKAKNFPLAIKHFSAAIELCPEEPTYYSNRSAAYLGHGQKSDDKEQLELSLVDAEKCVVLISAWPKGYIRKANALQALGRYEEAVKAYAQGIVECPAEAAQLMKGMGEAQHVWDCVKAGKPIPGTEKKKSKKKKKKGKKGKKEEEEKKDDEDEKYVIGIDLGTTFSCVAVWKGDGVHIITNEDGERTTPSYVCFDDTGARHTGQAAKAMQSRFPDSTVYDVKRVIGQRWTDTGVEKDIRSFPFTMVRGDGDKPMIEMPVGNDKKELFAPEAISAMVLGRLKKVAEDYLGCAVNDAVITVPAYFNDAQRNATKAAGLIAGLNVMRIINEPTAAALSYGLDNAKGKDKACNVLIFDLGGGTFDVSLLKIEDGVFEVKATAGDTRLGGEDFDHAVVEYLLEEAQKAGFADARENPKTFRRLRIAAEKAKRVLSVQQVAEVRVEAMGTDGQDFVFELSRDKFENINAGLFERCLDTVKRVLKDGKMKQEQVDEVVLVGGSTRVPKIQQMLQEFLGGKALCKSLNPDEAVAYGAAVQGAILSGRRHAATDNLLLMDVTPLSLGIETTGRVMSVIIPRNSSIPCVKTQVYTTEADYQTSVDISVYEGERLKTEENNLLGEFTISGIQRAKKGEPKVDVQFSLDSNGILSVKAKDQETGAEANIQIANRSRASADEVERMVKEAERFRREDERRIKSLEAANRLEEAINDAVEHVENIRNSEPKLAALVEKAAQEHLEWLEANRDDGSASDFNKRASELERRLASKNRRA